ncbi:hypothetical protein N8612_04625 [Verrucomicrobia bacterium]|nr:hypothetical protein [Verrucomicrobiota bacterium]
MEATIEVLQLLLVKATANALALQEGSRCASFCLAAEKGDGSAAPPQHPIDPSCQSGNQQETFRVHLK